MQAHQIDSNKLELKEPADPSNEIVIRYPQSKRGREFLRFASAVLDHIEDYTVAQYGDAGSDLASNYSTEHCLGQIEKYLKRAGKNARPGEQPRDYLKIAHYAQLLWSMK